MNSISIKFNRVTFSEKDGKSQWFCNRPPVATADQVFKYTPITKEKEAKVTIYYDSPHGKMQKLVIVCPTNPNSAFDRDLRVYIHRDVIHITGKIIEDSLIGD